MPPIQITQKILDFMRARGDKLFTAAGEVNIIAVEGMNLNGTLNTDAPDRFNDFIGALVFENGKPRWLGAWVCTTEPGRHYTQKRLNPQGAARIEFGQYSAWQVGIHNGDHEALIQTGGKLTVRRDRDNSMTRTNDPIDSGFFGINIHHGWNASLSAIGRTSAGCTVIPNAREFLHFMRLVKSEPRYRRNAKFVFTVAYLPGDKVLNGF